jgi:hypothetical protein
MDISADFLATIFRAYFNQDIPYGNVCFHRKKEVPTWSTPPDGYKNVSRDEFYSFIRHYKSKLISDWCGIGDVPVMSYNDFSLEEPVVAYCLEYNGEAYHHGKLSEYFIIASSNI